MTTQQKIEMGLRAAHLAKVILDLLPITNALNARVQLCEAEREIKQLRDFLAGVQ